jgi:hypothetical protein
MGRDGDGIWATSAGESGGTEVNAVMAILGSGLRVKKGGTGQRGERRGMLKVRVHAVGQHLGPARLRKTADPPVSLSGGAPSSNLRNTPSILGFNGEVGRLDSLVRLRDAPGRCRRIPPPAWQPRAHVPCISESPILSSVLPTRRNDEVGGSERGALRTERACEADAVNLCESC